ncbi:MAG TPA: SLC13 family permease [Candidatus Lokiarchaeia archaeon]
MASMQIASFIPIFVFAFVIILLLLGFRTPKKNRRIRIDYGIAPIIGVLILILTFSIGLGTIIKGVFGSEKIQPYTIIILFMSMAYICISLDLTGFFEYLALKVAKSAGNSGAKLFFYFYFFSGFLTIFTSNDIVILTITPIIIYFAKHTKINPVPFLIAEFFAANVWSIMIYVGNPTNIIVAEAYDLTFVGYTMWMFLPAVTAGFVCLALLWLVFRKKISKTFEAPNIDPKSALKDKAGAIFGVIILAFCLVMLSLASFFDLPLWEITLFFAIVMFLRDIIHVLSSKKHNDLDNYSKIKKLNKRMPWKIIPFVIGMFIIVEALSDNGWVNLFASVISGVSNNLFIGILIMGFLSTFACNLMNNQPMTILFTEILLSPSFNAPEQVKFGCMFALIMGSNFGANFTLIGALAGLMWSKIASDKGIHISFKQFAKYGFIVMPLVVFISLLVLYVEIFFWY